MMASMSAEELAEQPFSSRVWASVGRVSSTYLNNSILYIKTRWLVFFTCLIFYVLRVYFLSGFFVVTYGLGIYLLNLLIGFISPQIDPETDEYVLPVRGGGGSQAENGEFRPFLRQVPEFKAWVSGMRALLIAITMTFFQVFDLPVFWPILLVYFILLFVITMKQQVKRMIKYKYIPFSWGKQTYGDITRGSGPSGTVSPASTAAAAAPSYVSHEHFAATYVLR